MAEAEKTRLHELETEKLNETNEKLSQTFVVKSPAVSFSKNYLDFIFI